MPIRLSGMNSGLDTDMIVKELVSAYSLKTEKYEKQKTKLEWKQEAWKGLNSKIYNLYTNVSNLRYTSAYNMKKTTVSDPTKATVTASSSAVTGTQRLQVLSTAQTAYLTSGKLKLKDSLEGKVTKDSTLADLGYGTTSKEKIQIGDKSLEVTGSTKISDVITWLQKSEEEGGPNLNASFDVQNQRIFISAKESGSDANFELTASDFDSTTNNSAILEKLGFGTIQTLGDENTNSGTTQNSDQDTIAYKVVGSDAQIRLNGALYESKSNDFSVNGLNITVQGKTAANEEVLINTSVDAQGIYDKIKDFLTEYNNVINEMTKLYNADSAKDYEPLTDEEKEAMSDEEIEKWEGKIKDSLLRRDDELSNVMSGMINSMAQTIKLDDGTKLSLSSFGIQTLGFLNAAENEQNAYHIDGDADDENSSGKTDKLMKAIQNNADQVAEFMQKLAKNLYSAIDTKMKSTTLSSAYKVYNDKEMDSQLKNYEKLISDWEEKVADKEEYYYKKFSSMETALSKLQSQTDSLSGMLGM